MKDMYSFHMSDSCAQNTYESVGRSYERLLNRLDIKFIKAEASVGAMGGKQSHEYLVESEIGEDKIYECSACSKSISSDLIADQLDNGNFKLDCCEIKNEYETKRCIEVGHTFLLGNTFLPK